jgi:hypothetical protein
MLFTLRDNPSDGNGMLAAIPVTFEKSNGEDGAGGYGLF